MNSQRTVRETGDNGGGGDEKSYSEFSDFGDQSLKLELEFGEFQHLHFPLV